MDRVGKLIGVFREEAGMYRWDGLAAKNYNATGTQSRGMTKQILCAADERLPAELRYFEAREGGYSALERHDHVHMVVILRGRGSVLLDGRITAIESFDTVYIPPLSWHQFYADRGSSLGFLCLVNGERDVPQRPTAEEIEELKQNAAIRDHIRY